MTIGTRGSPIGWVLPDAGWRSTILPLRVEEVLLAGTVMVNWEGTSEVLIVLPEGKF